MLWNFSVAISVSPHVCFILVLLLISVFLRYSIYELGIFHANRTTKCVRNQGGAGGGGWSAAGWLRPPVVLLLAVPGQLFCFGYLVVLDMVLSCLSLCFFYILIQK